MFKKIFSISIIYGAYTVSAIAGACNVTYSEFPSSKSQSLVKICKSKYAVLYDSRFGNPIWTSYVLRPFHVLNGCYERKNNFHAEDKLAINFRIYPNEYDKSGYDRGHLVNAADMSYDSGFLTESFSMINMSPQYPNFNRGIWKQLESQIREWVVIQNTEFEIISGALVTKSSNQINGKLYVPNGFWKIVIDQQSGKYLAFIFTDQHNIAKNASLSDFISSIEEIQRLSGLNLKLQRFKQEKQIWDTTGKVKKKC